MCILQCTSICTIYTCMYNNHNVHMYNHIFKKNIFFHNPIQIHCPVSFIHFTLVKFCFQINHTTNFASALCFDPPCSCCFLFSESSSSEPVPSSTGNEGMELGNAKPNPGVKFGGKL